MNGAVARRKREHNDMAWIAWHTARLTAYAPPKAKDFPRLKDLLHDEKPAARKMTPDQLEAATRSWLSGMKKHRV